MSDRDPRYVHDGGPLWSPERALDYAQASGIEPAHVTEAREAMEAANVPAPPSWFGVRLSTIWTLFMAGRETDEDKMAVWLREMAALLSDLPADIVGFAIDEAIRKSRHGFAPSVGEIRQYADPLVEERRMHIDRLRRMEAALADPAATVERRLRRFNIEANARREAADEERRREQDTLHPIDHDPRA